MADKTSFVTVQGFLNAYNSSKDDTLKEMRHNMKPISDKEVHLAAGSAHATQEEIVRLSILVPFENAQDKDEFIKACSFANDPQSVTDNIALVDIYEDELPKLPTLCGDKIFGNVEFNAPLTICTRDHIKILTEIHNANPDSVGNGICLGIIDNGIRTDHNHFNGNNVNGENLRRVRGQIVGAGVTDDILHSHGTFMASIITGFNSDNTFIGVARDATVVSLKAFDDTKTSAAAVINVIDKLANGGYDYNIRVLNLSCAVNAYIDGIQLTNKLIKYANNRIVVVVAAGNPYNGKSRHLIRPAGINEFITVGQHKVNYTTTQGGTVENDAIILAPSMSKGASHNKHFYCNLESGSSMATAYVSGCVALMLSLYSALSPSQIKQILIETGTGEQGKHKTVNLQNAINHVKALKASVYGTGQPLPPAG